MKYLYHVTDPSNVPSILENGLEPRIGRNAAFNHEEVPYIYLCERKDIPYWKILLRILNGNSR